MDFLTPLFADKGPVAYTVLVLSLVASSGLLLGSIRLFGVNLGVAGVLFAGLLAGSMTDPPALAFATSLAGSDAPSVSYSTVYPLVMLLRVICAQAMVLFFMR